MRSLKPFSVLFLGLGVGLAVPVATVAQAKQAPPPAKKAAAPAPAPQKTTPAAPAPQKVTPAPAKTATPPQKAAPAPVKAAEPATVEQKSPDLSPGGRRDPFQALVASPKGKRGGETRVEGVGVAGMVTATLRVDGIVRSANGMIAVVRNSQGRVYFIREGTRISDGRIERITLEGVTIRESTKDPFGNPIERLVSKRLYPSAGE
jgi:Tfp pilus assembly protein PilP